MRIFKVKIIIGTIEISRHARDRVEPVLITHRLAQFYSRDLCDRIRFIGRLERTGQQVFLFDINRPFLLKKYLDISLPYQIKFAVCSADYIFITGLTEFSYYRRTNQSFMPR